MLETNEERASSVQIDTIGHDRAKTPTISVDVTFYADTGAYSKAVDIPITVYIRPDLVMTSGAADFGNSGHRGRGERQINIAYAGAESWKILEVKSGNPNVQPTLVQLNRGGGRVDYMLTIRVALEHPRRGIAEQLQLVTNDLNSPTVPYLVRANITPEFQVIPPVVKFGTLKPGEKKRWRSSSKEDAVQNRTVRNASRTAAGSQRGRAPDARTIHRVEITIDPPNEPGPVKETFLATIEGGRCRSSSLAKGSSWRRKAAPLRWEIPELPGPERATEAFHSWLLATGAQELEVATRCPHSGPPSIHEFGTVTFPSSSGAIDSRTLPGLTETVSVKTLRGRSSVGRAQRSQC